MIFSLLATSAAAALLAPAAPRQFFATCVGGLEPVLAAELSSAHIGATAIEEGHWGCRFEGDAETGARAVLWLRSALRVMEPLASAEDVYTQRELYNLARDGVDWPAIITEGQTLGVNAVLAATRSRKAAGGGRPGDWVCTQCGDLVFASKDACFRCGQPRPSGEGENAPLTHSHFTALTVKNACCDAMRDAAGAPSVDASDADVPLSLTSTAASPPSTASSGAPSMHKRGYRSAVHAAALKETLAAASSSTRVRRRRRGRHALRPDVRLNGAAHRGGTHRDRHGARPHPRAAAAPPLADADHPVASSGRRGAAARRPARRDPRERRPPGGDRAGAARRAGNRRRRLHRGLERRCARLRARRRRVRREHPPWDKRIEGGEESWRAWPRPLRTVDGVASPNKEPPATSACEASRSCPSSTRALTCASSGTTCCRPGRGRRQRVAAAARGGGGGEEVAAAPAAAELTEAAAERLTDGGASDGAGAEGTARAAKLPVSSRKGA